MTSVSGFGPEVVPHMTVVGPAVDWAIGLAAFVFVVLSELNDSVNSVAFVQ